MSTTVSTTGTVSNGGKIDGSTFADVKYGTVTYQNDNSKAYAAVSGSNFYLGTNSCYFKIELNKPLQTGDKIKLATMPLCSANNNGDRLNGLCFCTSSTRTTTYQTTDNVTENVEYIVPEGLNGIKTLYLFRLQGKGTSFNDMTITRESPTINISSNPATNLATNTTYYIDAQGNYTTEQPASYVATYSCTANNTDHGNQGTVITIPNATEGKYTVVLGGCFYNNGEYTIKSDNGAFTDITIQQSNTAACNDKITRSFLVEKPTTITITGGSYTYLPFFSVVQKVGFAVNIIYDPKGSGTVDVDGSLFKNGEEVTMTATPNHGYAFSKWQDATGNDITDNPYSFTMGTDDVTYTAVFNPLTLYPLSHSSEPSDGGSITCKDTNPSHPEGESITLTATPQTGYSFKGWKKGDETVSTGRQKMSHLQLFSTSNTELLSE